MSTGITSPTSAASLRPLMLEAGGSEHVLLIPTSLFTSSTELRDQFVHSLDPEAVFDSATELVAAFLEYVARNDAHGGVLPVVLNEFETRFLVGSDVHTLAAEVSEPEQLIRAYLLAREVGQRPIRAAHGGSTVSALLRAAEEGVAKITVVFGGQGNDYFEELRTLLSVYGALVRPLIEESAQLLQQLVRDTPEAAKVYSEWSLDVMRWLQAPADEEPPRDYLVSAPVSVPVIGLIQLAHYQIVCRILGLTPGEFRSKLAGATGHSQGVVTALAVAAADSWSDWQRETRRALTTLFFIGLRTQLGYPETAVAPSVVSDADDAGEGHVSPMLSVRDVSRATLDKFILQTNQFLPPERHVAVSLVNGPRMYVVSGPPMSLYGLCRALRSVKGTGENEGRVPYSQRKLKVTTRFLRVSVPFHSHLLSDDTATIVSDMKQYYTEPVKLGMPVYDTFDGHDMTQDAEPWSQAIKLITELPVNWEAATKFPGCTHIVDFGPGGQSGLAFLTHLNKEGTGVRVIAAGEFSLPPNSEIGAKHEIFDRGVGSVKYAPDWLRENGPKLVRWGDRLIVDTKMSRLLGRPPVMVAGMTPSTVPVDVVASTLNAGYHIELAGGGYFREEELRAALEDKLPSLTNGGITLNVLYVNPAMLNWCIPLVGRLRAQGTPIEGLTVGAGVPSIEVANEWITTLGLKHISFKPGTIESMRAAIAIAAANPTFPVIVQWTGGRGGGHHSFEDFHAPVLATYAQIRRQPNIVLVAGSGFGDAEGTYPYLTGEWSTRFEYPPMPFDGFLFGSRMMVAREFHTSPEAKAAIVSAPGVPDKLWEQTYKGPAGGVITVLSEMGEPIHKLATRGVLLWKELDDSVFALPRNKRVAQLTKMKPHLVKRLNADYQKVWFPQKTGKPDLVADVEDMTYAEIASRLVELMYVSAEKRWIDASLRTVTAKFVRRLEERLASTDKQSVLQSTAQLDEPHSFLGLLFKEYPKALTQLVSAQDKDFFLALCLERSHKPVPFVPALDENFEFWFKKDSLWQSEDLAAVPGQDVQRTCILHSPVAAAFSTEVNELAADILGGIHAGHIQRLLDDKYHGDASNVPVVEAFGLPAPAAHVDTDLELHYGVASRKPGSFEITADGPLPPADDWRAALAGPKEGWLHALLASPRIAQGEKHVPNALWRLLEPVHGMRVVLTSTSLKVWEKDVLTIEAEAADGKNITLKLWENRTATSKPEALELRYFYDDSAWGGIVIREDMNGRNDRIKHFYWRLWFGDVPYAPPAIREEWTTEPVEIGRQQITDFVGAIGNRSEAYVRGDEAPLDFAIVAGWQAITRGIFPGEADGDLLRLVHLGNQFSMRQGAHPLKAGDCVHCKAQVKSVDITASGLVVDVRGTLFRGTEAVVDVSSQFLYRGKFENYESTFAVRTEVPTELVLATPKDVAVLHSKEWFQAASDVEFLGKTVQVRCTTTTRSKSADVYEDVHTSGVVVHVLPTKEVVEVGRVEYMAGHSRGNPVTKFLERAGNPIEQPQPFERAIPLATALELRAPASNELYARVSGDYNPIHVSRAFAAYASLPGTITHGMYTSAAARGLVENWAASNDGHRVRAWKCDFVGMVLPNDTLTAQLEHIGMVSGRKLVRIRVSNDRDEPVLTGEAEVEQPLTAFVFTGQGSQEQGMGMDLYATSAVAREVWDRADRHFVATYGISILDIVRNNPREITVHFGGEVGQEIRENYMGMHFETIGPDGQVKTEPIFKTVTSDTDSYTFTSPNGVLAMTQFTQPALTLMEKAALEDMKSRGLVDFATSAFAGHSLGEYSALAAMADVMPVESLVDVVFYRGMTMQVAVPRDALGRSNYGMCAVNPSRIGRKFSDAQLRTVIEKVSSETGWLLEIVNFNVANQQYVAAGDLRALDTLSAVLDATKANGGVDVPEGSIAEAAKASTAKPQPITLKRGQACIPLPGISVPFHSTYLRSGVKPFKTFLSKRIARNAVKPASLVGKYIPNLTAKPFAVTREYFQEVYDLTSSPEIKRILDNWDEITKA